MPPPKVEFADRDGARIAWQAAGSGRDLVVLAGAACMSATYEDPETERFLSDLQGSDRLITFDQRGAGLSDPLGQHVLTLEERVADAFAVCDAAKADRPFVIGLHDGGPVALLATTAHPERFSGLVLINTAPRMTAAPDYPQGIDESTQAWFLEQQRTRWGTGYSLRMFAPAWAERPGGREKWARLERLSCSRVQAELQTIQTFETDARHLLDLVSIPTLIIDHRDDIATPRGNGRYLADRIRGSSLVELPGNMHMPWVGDYRPVVNAIRSFIGDAPLPEGRADERRLAAVVFTDIVGSTARASKVGDARWVATLNAHDAAAQRLATAFGGRWIKSTGDGLLAVFDGPARAVSFCRAMADEMKPLNLQIRAGIHAGEVTGRGADVAGIAVHIAARVQALASPNEILASRTVVDLTAGSDIAYRSRGSFALKGIEGDTEIFDVASVPDKTPSL